MRRALPRKAGHHNTASFLCFLAQTVEPTLQVAPACSMQTKHLTVLMQSLEQDPNVTPAERKAIFAMASGQIRHHPVVHGLMIALSEKFDCLVKGKTTMRDRYRDPRDGAKLLEAASELAALGCNNKCLEMLGLRWKAAEQQRSLLCSPHDNGIPDIVCPDEQALRETCT